MLCWRAGTFFIQLNEAKLLSYPTSSQYLYLDNGGDTGSVSEDLDTTEKASTLFPLSSLSGKTHLMIATPDSSYISTNDVYLTLTGISAIRFSDSVLPTTISPRIAHSIDTKTDDGMPESGNTLAMNRIDNTPITLGLVPGDSSADCIATSGSITHYNYMISAYADRPNCHIAFKTRY
ncbi:MAG: hypothetical protein LW823_07585 [Rickettsiales bacterium]|jgi:hypothetical protein|nr:hypothetical protein [Rickettsiales bacterium]